MRNGKFDKHEEAFSEKTEPDDIAFQAKVDVTLLLNVFGPTSAFIHIN